MSSRMRTCPERVTQPYRCVRCEENGNSKVKISRLNIKRFSTALHWLIKLWNRYVFLTNWTGLIAHSCDPARCYIGLWSDIRSPFISDYHHEEVSVFRSNKERVQDCSWKTKTFLKKNSMNKSCQLFRCFLLFSVSDKRTA